MLHGYYYFWMPGLIWLDGTTESLIALSYYSIFLLLIFYVWRQHRNLSYTGLLIIVGAFTLASGTTHLIDVWMLWHPNDWLAVLLKALNAAIPVVTVLLLLWLVPRMRVPLHSVHLQSVNQALSEEIRLSDRNRQAVVCEEIYALHLKQIRQLKAELEQHYNEQTAALQRTNAQLKSEIDGGQRQSEELRLLQSLTQTISEAPDFHSALCMALRLVCEVTNWDYGEVWLPSRDNAVLECNSAWYSNTPNLESFRQASEKLTFPPNIGLPGRVWISQAPEWIEDVSVQRDAAFVRPQAKLSGLTSGFAVPILIGDYVLAVLTFFIAQSRAVDKRWVELVAAVATQLGLVIQRKQLEEQLRQERDFSKTLIETSPAFFVAIDANGKIIMMNQGCLKALGYTLEETLGTDYLSRFVPKANREFLSKIFEQLVSLKQPTVIEHYLLAKAGQKLLVEWRCRAIFNKNGELDFLFGVGIDVTERRQVEKESARLASLALLTPNPIVETDLAGHVRYLNPEAMRLLPDLQGTDIKHPFLAGVPSIATILQQQGSLKREIKIGEVYYEQVLHYIAEIEGLRIYAFDISDRKLAEAQLIQNAFYDQLTGLANRALFMDRLQQAVQRVQPSRRDNSLTQPYLFAVLFLNLNRFKIVNDSLGNQIGDQLLQEFADRLQTCLRPTDTVARLGGDEFAVLLEGIQDATDATRVAESIQQTLALPFCLEESEVFMTVSIGIALNTSSSDRITEPNLDGSSHCLLQPEDLLRDADIAMYSAKAKGKSLYEVFDTAMHSHAVDRLQVETDLRRAIERQEFQVYYQPIVSLSTGKIIGFEALLRWQHPQRGLVSPSEFIPIAEETGLITPIGWWTMREACKQLSIWQAQFPAVEPLTINVNLSCKQFTQPELIEEIDKILQETQLAVGSLKLEITESVVMENPDLAKDLLFQLKERMIHLCIDDFGTGYSSLSRLHHFPISTLKIDRSFVSRIGALGENSEIVQAIVTLAQTLSMDVVAEGIELSEQVDPLIALQCDYGQGYFFSKPLDSDAARALLATQWRQWGMNST